MAIGTTAAIIGASLAAAGSIGSAAIGAHAAGKAADQVSTGQDKVAALTQDAVDAGQLKLSDASKTLSTTGDQISSLYDPYADEASTSLQRLNDLSAPGGGLDDKFSFTADDFKNGDPGYQETLKRGQEAIARSSAAQGGLFGTNTLKRLADWTVGTANQGFNDAFARAKTTFDTNRSGALARADTLKTLASLGLSGVQGKAGTQGQIATQINQNTRDSADLGLRGAENVGQAVAGSANAQAAGTVGKTNSWLDALKQGTNGIQQFLAQRAFSGSPTYDPTVDTGGANGNYGFGVGVGHP